MHNKSLANNPQKLPTVSSKWRTFKYFSTAGNFHCNPSVLAEEPFPILPHGELRTFVLNCRWWNVGVSLLSWAGEAPNFAARQAEGRRFTLWERSSTEMANGNYLLRQRSVVVESRSEAILSTSSSSAPFKYIHSSCRHIPCLFQLEETR